ncbi:arsenate reductase ArsC [Enterococcus sp. 10A9_DIV0425]|uniref:Arsenate reductase ArsC n=1 Tax=Candidatus Enterococcus wittei TaxID=1987383 RepID=A0A242JY16_9ENTE|nr:arsenate reductase family protein [Enterococcus sp. 10A9_DIV0425]OTP10214.1 arsenate reductase ArsC [Enterococcus sp. 10A9_DIV0425]
MFTFYWYPKCSTCRKAKTWLDNHQVVYQTIDMIQYPPTAETIEIWLKHSDIPIRRIFNTSGMKYRELGLKDQVDSLSIAQASQLLSTDGMLIKRPLIVKENQLVAIGFNEKTYEGALI